MDGPPGGHHAWPWARQALDTASRLSEHPDTRQAALGGEISLEQAREITDTPEAEAELLQSARHGDLRELRDRAREHRQAGIDAEGLRKRQLSLREFRHWQDRDGMIRFTGALPPETGLPLVRQVDRTARRLRRVARQGQGGARAERFDAYAADALTQLVAGAGGSAGRGKGRAEVDLVIVCDLNAWRRGHTQDGEPCHIIDGGPIPVEVARELSKDAFLKAVIHDGTNLSTIRHFGRHYPALLRTALDIGAPPTFPGRRCVDCGSPFGLERDHDNPIANGGPTAYGNLEDRCYSCHKAKTERDRQAGLLGPNPPAHKTSGGRRPGGARSGDPPVALPR